ncbi:hypothetical protein PIB30_090400 [Stylosanthes scabra]|uniref:RNA-binding S4 domain-containing protein n=1 Tax=Stylosanthes scabra TaxID=79078 RepID=A0ABU6WUA7_9FABA|nr:hypothetical protein [Stylosanthes scabra]
MFCYGLLDETQNKLDYVLALTVEHFLERRLLTLIFKSGMAKSIHHAKVLIRQRHISYCFQRKSLDIEDTLFGCQVSNLQVAEHMAVMAKNPDLSYCKIVEHNTLWMEEKKNCLCNEGL